MATSTDLRIVPLTTERWDDLAGLFGPRGADAGCWCMFFRRCNQDRFGTPERNREDLHALASDDPAPGLLAYDDDQAVGWVGLGPRRTFTRLERSRKYAAVDDLPVWSVVCFFIRKPARGAGVAGALLEGAIAYARQHSAAGVEAYAVDPAERMPDADAYHGTLAMFERAGFRRARLATSPARRHDRWIMRLEFT